MRVVILLKLWLISLSFLFAFSFAEVGFGEGSKKDVSAEVAMLKPSRIPLVNLRIIQFHQIHQFPTGGGKSLDKKALSSPRLLWSENVPWTSTRIKSGNKINKWKTTIIMIIYDNIITIIIIIIHLPASVVHLRADACNNPLGRQWHPRFTYSPNFLLPICPLPRANWEIVGRFRTLTSLPSCPWCSHDVPNSFI